MIPGPVLAHTKTAMAATNTSVIIPAAPTRTRFHLLRKAQAAVASIYGSGLKMRNMMPIV